MILLVAVLEYNFKVVRLPFLISFIRNCTDGMFRVLNYRRQMAKQAQIDSLVERNPIE